MKRRKWEKLFSSSEVEGQSVAGGEPVTPLWRGSFYFISYYGISLVILLDLFMVSCSISKDFWSVTELKSSHLHCSVCAQGWACWQGKGGCALVEMNWTKPVLQGTKNKVCLLCKFGNFCCAAPLWGEYPSVRQMDYIKVKKLHRRGKKVVCLTMWWESCVSDGAEQGKVGQAGWGACTAWLSNSFYFWSINNIPVPLYWIF